MLTDACLETSDPGASAARLHWCGSPKRPEPTNLVARTIVMHAIGHQSTAKRCCQALPKWRMKQLEDYLTANLDTRVGLNAMAVAVGLSKMHFAAQFRAATGFKLNLASAAGSLPSGRPR